VKVHIVQHVSFEGPGAIADWAGERGYAVTRTLAPRIASLPMIETDLLVIMGGPMGANDDASHPWLFDEMRAIAAAIEAGTPVLGICLGAQLVARVLGARVTRNPEPEVGWHEVVRTLEGASDPVFGGAPDRLIVGHWHGDTFGIPEAAVRTLGSEACANQAFSAEGGRVVGLQCHLEWRAEDVAALVSECGDDLRPGRWVCDPRAFIAGEAEHGGAARSILHALLDAIVARNGY
jgi:GMP synthase-like glutamine amidotransferase